MNTCKNIETTAKKLKDQNDLKKQLPKGTCILEDYKRYQYIRDFMKDKYVYRYILPLNHVYSPFVVIRRTFVEQKFPIYCLYYHPTNTFILSAQEQNMNIGCNYIISSNQKPRKDIFFVSKLRGNFNRNQFHLYDNGNNPQKRKNNNRKQFAYIQIDQAISTKKKSKLSMYVPRPYESNRTKSEIIKYQPMEFECQVNNPNPILQDVIDKCNLVEILQLKQSKVQQPNNKNCQSIILESSVRTQSFFARRKSQTFFELEIGNPLTIIQGFGFLLTLIESKII